MTRYWHPYIRDRFQVPVGTKMFSKQSSSNAGPNQHPIRLVPGILSLGGKAVRPRHISAEGEKARIIIRLHANENNKNNDGNGTNTNMSRLILKSLYIADTTSTCILTDDICCEYFDKFQSNNTVHMFNTRFNDHLHIPIIHLSAYQRGVYYSGVKRFNTLPKQISALKIIRTNLE
jgi:hypothetical protein